ncbi:hypothetical protein U1Q18_052614 [Sarracenia purpurea var. burkii]
MEASLAPKFKIPQVDRYDGNSDPLDHLHTYTSMMYLYAVPDEIMCRTFPSTLRGPAQVWFSKIKPLSIVSFAQLSKMFTSHFVGAQRHRKPVTSLLNVKQTKEESLRAYVNRFNQETLQVDDGDEKIVVAAFMKGLFFLFSLVKSPPESRTKLMIKARNYMNAEDVMETRRAHAPKTKKRQRETDQNW